MSPIKQIPIALLLLAGVLWLWLAYVPSARPLLDRAGIPARLESIGITLPGGDTAGEGGAQAAQSAGQQGGRPQGAGRPAITVIAELPGKGRANDRISAIGNGQAVRSVMVTPAVAGRLSEVTVQSGDKVAAGQIIARLDREAEEIAVERARLLLADAADRRARVARLQGSGAASEMQITEAELALQQASLELREAEFNLSRREIAAPIGGWVGILRAEPGQQISAGGDLTIIDDRSSILVDFRVPERFVGQIKAGDVLEARPLALRNISLQGIVTAVDNRVDETSRTLLVEASLNNADDTLRSGMAFEISVAVQGETYVSVNPLSIQWGSEGAFVWRVRDGRAERATVTIVQRSADAVLVEGDLDPAEPVVTEGVQALRPGVEVKIKGQQAGLAPAAPRTGPQVAPHSGVTPPQNRG